MTHPNKKIFIAFFFLIFNIIFCNSLSFKSKRISNSDSKKIEELLGVIYRSFEDNDWREIENLFYKNKLNIYIESNQIIENYNNYNYLGKIHNINEIQLYQAYRNKAGKIIKKMEVSKDFDSQSYDYPIGNIYYIKINVEYENLKTNEYFFIVKTEEKFKIYELKIVLL